MGNDGQQTLGETQPEEQISVIGKRFSLKGDLAGEGMLVVYGRLDGNIHCDGLIVNEGGSVHGEVHCQKVDLYGQIKGHVVASEVVIRRSGRLEGELHYAQISVETGAELVAQMQLHKVAEARAPDGLLVPTAAARLAEPVYFDLPPEVIQAFDGGAGPSPAPLLSLNGQKAPDWLVFDPKARRLGIDIERYRERGVAYEFPLRIQLTAGARSFELIAAKPKGLE